MSFNQKAIEHRLAQIRKLLAEIQSFLPEKENKVGVPDLLRIDNLNRLLIISAIRKTFGFQIINILLSEGRDLTRSELHNKYYKITKKKLTIGDFSSRLSQLNRKGSVEMYEVSENTMDNRYYYRLPKKRIKSKGLPKNR